MLTPLPNRIEFGVEMSDTATNCQLTLDSVSVWGCRSLPLYGHVCVLPEVPDDVA